MEKREKRLLALMGVAVLYGAYTFLMPSGEAPKPQTKQLDLNASVSSIQQGLIINRLSQLEKTKIALAEGSELENPFEPLTLSAQTEGMQTRTLSNDSGFHYSGFIEMNGQRIAIVNGQELSCGEQLDNSAFTLVDIRHGSVRLERTSAADGSREQLTVPLEDDTVNVTEELHAQKLH